MESLWVLWLGTAAVGGVLAALRQRSHSNWLFDALLLFLLASLVCDALAALSVIGGWRLNPYAISAGFALVAWARGLLPRRTRLASG
jgi:hypothetical protein